MRRAQLDDIRARGEPLAALWASEESIYGRFGYGLASWAGEINLAREYTAFARPFERRARLRIVERDEALELFPPLWRGLMSVRPGMHERTRPWWEDRALANQEWQEPGGPKRFVVCELDGEPRGYAIYRHHPKFDAGVSAAQVSVVEAIAADPDAMRELWRYLLDIDWAATIRALLLPPDHPLFLLLATPRRARYRMGDGLWVRIVDAGAALSARAYVVGEPLVLELADAFCPWNEGRWKLEGGTAERTRDEADLALDVTALGSAYLGGFGFSQLARGGRVEELREGGIARADALFRADRLPWCPEIF
jgi:predicted acetyltransferase